MTQPDPLALAAALATVREARNFAEFYEACILLARWLVERLDAGELVRVRGLEWKETDYWSKDVHADTVTGRYSVWSTSVDGGGWKSQVPGNKTLIYPTRDEAKSAAEQHYRDRLAAALETIVVEDVK